MILPKKEKLIGEIAEFFLGKPDKRHPPSLKTHLHTTMVVAQTPQVLPENVCTPISEVLPSQEEINAVLLKAFKLFETHHHYTVERASWISKWIGMNEYKTGKISIDIINCRVEFLSSVWRNKNEFRPFDTIRDTSFILHNRPEIAYILRLSTSTPGNITLSMLQGQQIIHKRFIVLENKRLCNSQGVIYENLSHIGRTVTETLQPRKEVSTPAQ